MISENMTADEFVGEAQELIARHERRRHWALFAVIAVLAFCCAVAFGIVARALRTGEDLDSVGSMFFVGLTLGEIIRQTEGQRRWLPVLKTAVKLIGGNERAEHDAARDGEPADASPRL